MRTRSSPLLSLALLLGCSSEPVDSADADGVSGTGGADGAASAGRDGAVIEFDVSARSRTYVDLAGLGVVESDGTGTEWDLA